MLEDTAQLFDLLSRVAASLDNLATLAASAGKSQVAQANVLAAHQEILMQVVAGVSSTQAAVRGLHHIVEQALPKIAALLDADAVLKREQELDAAVMRCLDRKTAKAN